MPARMTNAIPMMSGKHGMSDTTSQGDVTTDFGLDRIVELRPSQLLYMAKGFSRIFWGLLFTLVLFFANASFELFHSVRIPAYVIGSALVGWGLLVLRDAGRISGAWLRRSRIAGILVCLEIYFAPFVAWWRNMPYVSFFLINWLGLLLTGMLTMFYINLLAAESERCLNDRGAQIESNLFAVGVVLLMIVPFLISVVLPAVAAIRHETSLYFEIWCVVNRVPPWAYAFITVPCSLTLVASWKAKDRCYHEFLAGEDEGEGKKSCSMQSRV